MLQSILLWASSLAKKDKRCDGTLNSSCVFVKRFELLEKELLRVSDQLGQVQSDLQKLLNRS